MARNGGIHAYAVRDVNSLQEESQNPRPWWRIISHTRIVVCSIELILSIVQQLKRFVVLPGNSTHILRSKTQRLELLYA
jgi:hypothetical protein